MRPPIPVRTPRADDTGHRPDARAAPSRLLYGCTQLCTRNERPSASLPHNAHTSQSLDSFTCITGTGPQTVIQTDASARSNHLCFSSYHTAAPDTALNAFMMIMMTLGTVANAFQLA